MKLLVPASVLGLALGCGHRPPPAADASLLDVAIDAVAHDVVRDVAPDVATPDAPADVAPDAVDASDASDANDAVADDVASDADAYDPGDAGPVTVRVMAGNLSSGSDQSYTPGDGARIFAGMHPDVAMIQEFNEGANAPSDLRGFVDTAFGAGYQFTRGSGALPNGVISRYAIADAGEWVDPRVTNRGFVWARIDVPGPRDLWAVSLHLLSSGTATDRDGEAMALVARIQIAIPPADFLVIGGDFNTDSRAEPCVATLAAVVATDGPYPVDQAGNANTNASRARPYDWVVGNAALTALEVPVAIGANAFAHGLVFDTRVYAPITDVAPATAADSAAAGMQHMGVVRDFTLPP